MAVVSDMSLDTTFDELAKHLTVGATLDADREMENIGLKCLSLIEGSTELGDFPYHLDDAAERFRSQTTDDPAVWTWYGGQLKGQLHLLRIARLRTSPFMLAEEC